MTDFDFDFEYSRNPEDPPDDDQLIADLREEIERLKRAGDVVAAAAKTVDFGSYNLAEALDLWKYTKTTSLMEIRRANAITDAEEKKCP